MVAHGELQRQIEESESNRIVERGLELLKDCPQPSLLHSAALEVSLRQPPPSGNFADFSMGMHSPLSIHARCRLADKGDAKAQAIAAVQSAAEANRVASLLESPAKVEPISTAGHRVSRQHVRNAIRKGDAISAAQLTLTLDNQEGGWEAPMLLARLATEGLLEHSLIGTMHLSRALEFQGWNRSATFFPWLATWITTVHDMFSKQECFSGLGVLSKVPGLEWKSFRPTVSENRMRRDLTGIILSGVPRPAHERVGQGIAPSLHDTINRNLLNGPWNLLGPRLEQGVPTRVMWEAAGLAATQLLCDGPSELDIIWVHALTTLQALRWSVSLLDDVEATEFCLVGAAWVALYHLAFGNAPMEFSPKPRRTLPSLSLEKIESWLEEGDAETAGDAILSYGTQGNPSAGLISTLARLASTCQESHIVKYTQAQIESFQASSAPERWFHLAAAGKYLARGLKSRDAIYKEASERLGGAA